MLGNVLRGLGIMNVGMEWESLAFDYSWIFGKFRIEKKRGGEIIIPTI
jgi:hypothetical protein